MKKFFTLLTYCVFLFFSHDLKAQVYGQPIVTWDFANGIPSNWTQGINSTTDLAQWEYRGPNTTPDVNEGARGSCSVLAQPITSVTQMNGFVIFDSNYWDDPGDFCGQGFGTGPDPGPHEAWLTTNPVDFSSVTNAVLTFQQQYRHFGATTTRVQISVNGGADWTDIIVNTGVQSLNSEWKSTNISSIVTGQSDVRFRFLFNGIYYWWLLDDINVYIPNDNDLMLIFKGYTDNTGIDTPTQNFNLEYDQYPIGMLPPFKFRSAVHNVGGNTQTGANMNVSIIQNGTTEVYNQSSGNVTVPASVIQNLNITDTYTPPSNIGDYKIYYNINQNQEDQSPANNIDSLDYSITAYTFAKDEGAMQNSYVQTQLYDTYQMEAGNFYEAFAANKYVHSIKAAIAEGTTVGKEIVGKIYNSAYDSVLVQSAPYIINLADLNSPGEEDFVTLYFEDPFLLQNDSLYFAVVAETDSSDAFSVARSGVSFGESSLIRYPGVNATFPSNRNFMVRLNIFPINQIPGCTDTEAMNYNPAATTDDASCKYPGCTVEYADNYIPSANFDDGSCLIGGCMDPTAANYNALANYESGTCLFPGCTDPTALNFLPGSNTDDGSCFYLYTDLVVSNISGCPPLTILINNNNNITDNSQCSFVVGSNNINENCDAQFEFTFDEPGEYELTYTISIGNSVADTTVSITVFEVPALPVLTYNTSNQSIICTNCGTNSLQWYNEGLPLIGQTGSALSIVQESIPQNGTYSLDVENQFGCEANSDNIDVVQPVFSTSVLEGCAPFTVTVSDMTDQIEGLSSTLSSGAGEELDNFTGSTEFIYENAGTYTITLNSSFGSASSTATATVTVSTAATPVLVQDEANDLIVCTNCNLFTEITWNIDGTLIEGGTSQPNGGNYYGITVATENGCGSSAILLIEGVGVSNVAPFSVYPNPATDFINVTGAEAFSIELYDALGKRITQSGSRANTQRLDTAHLESGTYTIRITSDNGIYHTIVVIE
jgi:hypothetical protein